MGLQQGLANTSGKGQVVSNGGEGAGMSGKCGLTMYLQLWVRIVSSVSSKTLHGLCLGSWVCPSPHTTSSAIFLNGSPYPFVLCLVSLRTSVGAGTSVQKLNNWPTLDHGAQVMWKGRLQVEWEARSRTQQMSKLVMSSEEGTGPFFLQRGRK